MRGTIVTIVALSVLAGLFARTAGAQTLQLRISPREDGGETITFGNPSTPMGPRAQPSAQGADGRALIAQTAAMVTTEIAGRGQLSPRTAREAVERLTGRPLSPRGLDAPLQVLFYRTVAYAAGAAGDADLASRAAQQWARTAPMDAAALRACLMAAMLNRDRDDAVEAAERLASPAHESWAEWTRYMTPLAALAGARPELDLTTADGRMFQLADQRGTVLVLYFWTAASGDDGVDEALTAQRRLLEGHRGGPVAVVGVNLDEKVDRDAGRIVAALRQAAGALPQVVRGTAADGSAVRAMDLFGVTAVPTAVVLATDGSVIFAGDPRTWEIHTAIDYALSGDPHAVATAAPQAPQTPETTPEPNAATEREAQRLRDQGWDLLRLGLKTGSAAHKRQGLDILERVVREYPGTRGAKQAQRDLIEGRR